MVISRLRDHGGFSSGAFWAGGVFPRPHTKRALRRENGKAPGIAAWQSGQFLQDERGHVLDGDRAVHGDDLGRALLLEVVHGGHGAVGFVVIDVVALVDGGLVLVVGPGGELAAADPADQLAVLFRRLDGLEGDVVGVVVVVGAEAAAHDAVLRHLPVEHDFDHIVQLHARLGQGAVQGLGLGRGAREAVEQPALFLGTGQGFQHHRNGDLVRHQVAPVDVLLGLFAQFGAALDVAAENRAGFDVVDAVLVLQDGALGALAAAVRSEDENVHVRSFANCVEYAPLPGKNGATITEPAG